MILSDEQIGDIPEKLRCAICSGLARVAVRTPCCEQSICEECHRVLGNTCPICEHSPLLAPDCQPNSSLRITVAVFIRHAEQKLKDAEKKKLQNAQLDDGKGQVGSIKPTGIPSGVSNGAVLPLGNSNAQQDGKQGYTVDPMMMWYMSAMNANCNVWDQPSQPIKSLLEDFKPPQAQAEDLFIKDAPTAPKAMRQDGSLPKPVPVRDPQKRSGRAQQRRLSPPRSPSITSKECNAFHSPRLRSNGVEHAQTHTERHEADVRPPRERSPVTRNTVHSPRRRHYLPRSAQKHGARHHHKERSNRHHTVEESRDERIARNERDRESARWQ